MSDPKELFEQAMKLPPDARAALAHDLLDTLAPEVDGDVDAAWREEVRARMEEMDRGEGVSRPWDEVREELNDLIRSRSGEH